MSFFQLITSGPWMAWAVKVLLIAEMAFLSRNWAKQLLGVYQSGPFGEAALAFALGLVGYFCLNGIFEGFNRGNMLGLAVGCLGLFLIGKVFLVLFAPHYLPFLPF